ncbi:VanZ family protein [Methylomonas montana]|uniref:VanZ family protein n=1 Tax=Methylomonas montana TaxID=3058963 RepID=UPI00265A4A2B|nr:VanZ family protein [Methylomonas montana]WKJ90119.1 VanZ family protein [Methylomonas montana]
MAKFKGNRKLAMLFILLSIGWIGILFAESSQPPAKIMGEVSGLDKLAHFVAFGVLAFFLCAVAFCVNDKPAVPLFSMPLLVSALSGILEEGYQMTVPGRAGSLLDLTADLSGAAFVILLVNRYCIKRSCH